MVEAVTPAGAFVVVFEEYGEKEEVGFPDIEPPPEVEEVYKGVSAPKRRKVEEAAPVAEIPKARA
jgi:survival-of-motor-neuron-related-splicing factor 30